MVWNSSTVTFMFLCSFCRWFLWIRLSGRVQTGRWCPSSPEETASRSPSPTGRSTWSEPSSTGCTRSIDRYDRTSPDLRAAEMRGRCAAWLLLRIRFRREIRVSDFIVSSDGWIWSCSRLNCSSVVSSRCCRLDKVQKDAIWQKYLWFKGSVHSKYKNLFLSWPRLI